MKKFLAAIGIGFSFLFSQPASAQLFSIQITGDVTCIDGGTGVCPSTISANAISTAKLANSSVTYAKMQNAGASRLIGNPTGSPAAPSEISLAGPLSFSGTALTIANGAITNAMLGNSAITIGGAVTSLGGSVTATTILDSIGTTSGGILYRGGSAWGQSGAFTANSLLIGGGAGSAPGSVAITGLVDGNNTSAPTAYPGTSCTNQFPRSLNAHGIAACASVAITTDVSGLGTGVATFLATPSSANLAAAVTDESGTGALLFAGGNIGAATGTSLSVTGQLTSTVVTGTAPLVVSSTTNVANLNASSLGGATFAAPGAIGSGTASSGAFTTLSASSTVSGTGFSTYLASPPAIGSSAAAAGTFTTLSGTGGTHTGITSLGIRDTSAAFDVTVAMVSSTALTAGRTLTIDMKNVAHTFVLGATANTITFPNSASYTLIGSGDTGTVTNTMLAGSIDLTAKVAGLLPPANGGLGISGGASVALASWPSAPNDASGASLTFTAVTSRYAETNGVVEAWFNLTYPSTVSGSSAIIGNLPISVPNQTYASTPVPCYTTSSIQIQGLLTANSTQMLLVKLSDGSQPTNSNLSLARVQCHLTYPAN